MSIRIVCKECREIYNVSEDMAGKRLRCRRCEAAIRVPGQDDSEEDDRPSRRISNKRRSSYDDEVPARSRRSAARSDFDDEHEGRSTSNTPILLMAGGGGVLLLLLLVGAGFLVSRSRNPVADNGPAPVVAPPAPAPVVIGNPAFQPGAGGNDPPSNPSPAPVTGGPLPGVMDPADVARVKRSTVMIRVELPNGSGGEGSGFFAMGREMIVTNAHVLGMLSAESLPPSKLTVIVHSGEAGEFSVPGRVLGVDRQNDLAIVGISGVGRTLPPPLAVAHAEKLHETQKVYIFGYPLGSQLGRNLTVSESSVSSLGRDENRTLTQVQVNGGMHHGNSGGPVTDSRGNVVAVSVAGIRGTQIKFAIPAEFVHQAAVGRLAGEEVGNPYREGGKLYLPVVVKTLDPMQKLREVKVDVWAGRPGAPRLGEAGKTPQPHDSPRQTVVAQLRDNAYYAAVPIPVQEPGNVVWIQSWNGGERPVYGAAHPVPYNANMILERQAINLTYVPAQAERLRTVRLKNTTQISLVRGKDTISVSQNLDTMMLERQEGNPNRLPLPRDEPC